MPPRSLPHATCGAALPTGCPTLRIASKKSRGLPHSELMKIAVTLTAIATIADTGFVLRQHAGMHVIDAELTGDLPRRALVVAGDQNRLETGVTQRGQGLNCIGPERIAQGDNAERAHRARPQSPSARLPRALRS